MTEILACMHALSIIFVVLTRSSLQLTSVVLNFLLTLPSTTLLSELAAASLVVQACKRHIMQHQHSFYMRLLKCSVPPCLLAAAPYFTYPYFRLTRTKRHLGIIAPNHY